MRFASAALSVTLVFLFLSCMTGPEQAYEAEPEWMTIPPAEEGAYYGIGGSDTGNEAEDREIAISRAQSNLAASISVDIVSEMELSNNLSSDGNSQETLKSRIHQSVSQSLVNLETVDSWYHPQRGYWILFRMDKAEWEEQKSSDRRVSLPPPKGLEEHSGYNIPFLAALTNMDLPLQLLPGGKNTAYEISLDWLVSDLPVLDESGGIHFSRLRGIVSFSQYGVVLFSREYGPVKEGGLSHEQARERGAIKILEEFKNDEVFKEEIAGVLPQ